MLIKEIFDSNRPIQGAKGYEKNDSYHRWSKDLSSTLVECL